MGTSSRNILLLSVFEFGGHQSLIRLCISAPTLQDTAAKLIYQSFFQISTTVSLSTTHNAQNRAHHRLLLRYRPRAR